MSITIEETNMLAALERDMDSGSQPYVMMNGYRCAFSKEALDELGVVSGQAVSTAVYGKLLEFMIASCEAQIALNELTDQKQASST